MPVSSESDAAFPIFTVEDLGAAVAFYGRLGFVETYRFPPEGAAGYVTLERGGHRLGLATGGTDHLAFWVYVPDVDAAFRALVASGAPVVAEPHDEPWGERVASVRDPAGNLVHLGAPPPPVDDS